MRVAFVTSWPEDPSAPAGGVEAVSVNLVEMLAGFGDLELHVVTTKRSYSSLQTERGGAAEVHRLPWAGGRTLANAVGRGRRQMQEYLTKVGADIVHAHDTYGLMVKGMAMPRVFTVHGFIYGDTLVSGSRFATLRSWMWRRVETAGWADQLHIISISPYVRERITAMIPGMIHDIDNPVSEPFFAIGRERPQEAVFCAAAITARKNILPLVDAVAQLVCRGVKVKLRLAGSLEDRGYVRQVRDRIERNRLAGHVSLLGRIDMDRVRAELSTAAVLALTSLEENSPMGIEEAMAAGVPVVASNRCGMPYLIRDGESGFLVDPNDPGDIAWRLGQLLENDALRRSMGTKGREIALDRFHPAKVAARTRDVYLRAVWDFRGT